jgi:hypothetical protein
VGEVGDAGGAAGGKREVQKYLKFRISVGSAVPDSWEHATTTTGSHSFTFNVGAISSDPL